MSRKIRRVCLYGGPGVGKSVTAARLYSELSLRGFQVEHINEYVKDWAYLGRKPIAYDQVYIFGKQLHREDVRIRSVDAIVTDSPIMVAVAYARYYDCPVWKDLANIARHFEDIHPSVNILLDRTGIDYVENGRYQDHTQAKEVDAMIEGMVREHCPPESIVKIPTIEFDRIVDFCTTQLQEKESEFLWREISSTANQSPRPSSNRSVRTWLNLVFRRPWA